MLEVNQQLITSQTNLLQVSSHIAYLQNKLIALLKNGRDQMTPFVWHKSSCRVKIRLHTENQLPEYPQSW